MLAHKVGQNLAGQRRVLEGCPVPGPRRRGHARRALGHQRQDVLRVLHEHEVALGLRHGRRPSPVREADCRRGYADGGCVGGEHVSTCTRMVGWRIVSYASTFVSAANT